MTAPSTAEAFSITTEALDPGESRDARRLSAQGALTELGGELSFAAVISLLDVGVLQMTLDLSQLTTVEQAGLGWLHRAWLQVEGAGGHLWTIGVAEHYRPLIPTSRPRLILADEHAAQPSAATCGPLPSGRA